MWIRYLYWSGTLRYSFMLYSSCWKKGRLAHFKLLNRILMISSFIGCVSLSQLTGKRGRIEYAHNFTLFAHLWSYQFRHQCFLFLMAEYTVCIVIYAGKRISRDESFIIKLFHAAHLMQTTNPKFLDKISQNVQNVDTIFWIVVRNAFR